MSFKTENKVVGKAELILAAIVVIGYVLIRLYL